MVKNMPIPAYMLIEGEKQGLITKENNTYESVGNSWQSGFENSIVVLDFEHSIDIPTDTKSGLPSGQRIHNPISITKIFDRSTPLLYSACVSGEKLTKCEIQWYRANSSGSSECYFTHILEDAIITKILYFMPSCVDPKFEHFTHHEKLTFFYRKLTLRHNKSNEEVFDDWILPYK